MHSFINYEIPVWCHCVDQGHGGDSDTVPDSELTIAFGRQLYKWLIKELC